MSNLPTTLEEMQYQILQGDLSANAKLQASTIPAKDKELKTNAKKIIPAINELLKVIETCKVSIDEYSDNIETKVLAVTAELEKALKENQLIVLNNEVEKLRYDLTETVATLEEKLNKSYATTIEEKINSMGMGGNKMQRVLVEEVIIPSNGSVTLNNIVAKDFFIENVVAYGDGSLISPNYYNSWENVRHNQLSRTTPAEPFTVKKTGETITIINTSNNQLELLVYKYANVTAAE